MPVHRTGFLLLAGAMILPTAVADDRHAFDVAGGTLTLPPAPEAYVLREGAYVEVPRSLLLDPHTHAILRVGDKIVGEADAPGHLLGGTAATRITFDNADTSVPRRGVVSVEIAPAVRSGLLSGLLGGGSGSARFVYFAAEPDPAPVSPTPVVPTPPPTPTPPPPPPSVPTPAPTPPTASANATAPPASTGSTSPDAANGAPMSAAFRGLLPTIPVWSALKLALLATGAVGVLAVVRLGRP